MSFAKLVRNNVPDMIRDSGAIPITHRAGPEERRLRLRENLREGIGTFIASDPDIFAADALADIQEIIRAICAAHNITLKELEQRRATRAKSYGTYSDWTVWDGNK